MKKFMFDLKDFEAEALAAQTPPAPSFSESELNDARQEAYARGYQSGIAETKKSQDEVLNNLLGLLEQKLGAMIGHEDERQREMVAQALHLTLKSLKKLMPHLPIAMHEANIQTAVEKALDERHAEPRIVISVHEEMLEILKNKIDALASKHGFGGKAILFNDPSLMLGDCRIEWADGGFERLMADVMDKIEGEIKRSLFAIENDAG